MVDKNRPYARVLEEYENGSLTVSYVYGDDLISQDRGSRFYYQYDGQMSTRQLTDGIGDVTDIYVYDGFGILIDQAGVTVNNYLYTGEQYIRAGDGFQVIKFVNSIGRTGACEDRRGWPGWFWGWQPS